MKQTILWGALCAAMTAHDAGAYQNVGSTSNPGALYSAIMAVYNTNGPGVTINPGTYLLPTPSGGAYTFEFDNMTNFVIDAYNVNLTFSDAIANGFDFVNCSNVTFAGATVTAQRPCFTQGQIVGSGSDGTGAYFVVQIDAGYPTDFTNSSYWNLTSGNAGGYFYDQNTLRYKTGANDFGIKTYAVNNLSQREYNIYINGGLPPQIGTGDYMVISEYDDGRAIQITGGVTWQDQVWSMGCYGACFGGGSSVPIIFTNVVITNQSAPPGASVPGLFGFSGLNLNELRVGPTIVNCTFAGGGDDTFNNHGQWDDTGSISGTTLTYGYLGGDDITKGDTIRFYNKLLQLVDSATVESAPTSVSFTAPSNSVWHVFQSPNNITTWAKVTLDHVVAAQYDFLINDVSASGAGAVYMGNHFINNRSNGILIKSENDVIADNVFDGQSQSGVAAFPSLYWNEGGSTRNMVVTNNVFMNCGYWDRSDLANCGAMTIALDGDPGGLLGPIITNVLVAGNTFSNNAAINIVVKYATAIILSNNLMEWTHQSNMDPGKSLGFDPGGEVWLGSSSNITLAGNQVTHEGPYADGLVDTNSTATGIIGLSGGVVLVSVPSSAPSGLTANPGAAQVILAWSSVSGATSYDVQRSTVSGGPYTSIAPLAGTEYIDTDVTPGTTYYYVVASGNVAGFGNNSGQVSATPSADPTPVAWFEADAIEGVNSGEAVATWNDSSGYNNNATNATAAKEPSYVTNAMNGQPVVRFNSASSSYLAFPRPVSNDFTIIFVFQSTQGIGNGGFYYQGAGLVNGEVNGVTNDFGTCLNTNGQICAGTGNPDTQCDSGNGYNDGRPHVVTFKRTKSSGALALYVDGSEVATATGNTQSLSTPGLLTLGCVQTLVNYLTGDIAEVQVYNAALSDSQRESLEAGLMSKYAVDLPTPLVWFRADAITGLLNGAKVSTWTNVAGSGFNTTQTVSGDQPAYVTGALSGLPVVRFTSANSTYMSFNRPVSNDFTIVLVYQSTQGIGTGTAFFQGAGLVSGEVGGVTNDFGTCLNANGQVCAGSGNPDTSINSGDGYNDGSPHVVTFKRTKSTGAMALYLDGNQVATGTGGTQSLASPSVLTLGCIQTLNNFLSGDLAEVLVFNTALTDAQREAEENLLISKYAVALPAPWFSQDINASLPGGAVANDDLFTVKGSGSDIYNSADQFRFVYQEGSTSSTSVEAEVDSVADTDIFAKGGVMIRETLNNNSTFALAHMRPDGQVQFVWRSSTGSFASGSSLTGGTGTPKWLEIVRDGDTFSAYYKTSATGSWTQIGTPETIDMADSTEMGLAVTSHNVNSACIAVFNSVTASP